MTLSASDFQAYQWESVVGTDDRFGGRLSCAANACYAEADRLRAGGDDRGASLFELIGHVTSLQLRSDSADDPFTPSVVWGQSRSAAITDLKSTDIDVLQRIVPDVRSADLRARIADIVWAVRRDNVAARTAIAAYLAGAAPLITSPEKWSALLPCIQRALRIEVQLGVAFGESGTAVPFIVAAVRHHAENERGFLTSKLFELLLSVREGNAEEYHSVSRRIAEAAEADSDWHRARVYWECAARWASRTSDSVSERDARQRLAESFVVQAERELEVPNAPYLVAASHLQSAIATLRAIGGNRSRINELHARLLEYQREATRQLIPITSRADITGFAADSRKAVTGKPFLEAILVFAFRSPLPAASRLREQAEENSAKYLLSRFFPKHYIGPSGKTISVPGSTHSSNPEEREAALRAEMFELAGYHFQFLAGTDVWPMKIVIAREHALRSENLIGLFERNILIPAGREGLWAEGVKAGFAGDMPKAVHILIPQLEHALRCLLEQAGMLISTLGNDGIQKELNLNNLLYREHGAKLRELLGEDLVFAMQTLLVEKAGPDLRNRSAHGMMSEAEFYGPYALCAWWLMCHFALLPIRRMILSNAGDPSMNEVDSGDSKP